MPMPEEISAWAERLVRDGVAGPHRSHSHHNNMGKLRRTLEGDPDCTFGVHGLENMTFDEAMAVVGRATGWRKEAPTDFVDPLRTIDGALDAGRLARKMADLGGEVVVATGHPDNLLPFLTGIADTLVEAGVTIRRQMEGASVRAGYRVRSLEYEGCVAVLADDWGGVHTHSPEGMLTLLSAGSPPDLVVADHGWAGAAMQANIPTVATFDTNDPALALAAARGKPGALIPLDDGMPSYAYVTVLEAFRSGFEE